MIIDALKWLITNTARTMPAGSMLDEPQVLKAMLAVFLVCLICGGIGSLVVGNRMAFFSDALAHCTFAGVALGLLIGVVVGAEKNGAFYHWTLPAITVVFGILVGISIAFVREKTSLSSDTVIGVFFAGAIGFGAMFFKALNTRTYITPERFIFGEPVLVDYEDLLLLLLLTLLTFGLLGWMYNRLAFTSFNMSLARSRQMPIRLFNYLFIVLLALIVNLCLKTVGALLINALLIVPAAAASNLSRNMRQMFWLSIAISLFSGIAGATLSMEVPLPDPSGGDPIYFGWSGTIVVVSVLLFFLTMIAKSYLNLKRGAKVE